MRRIMLAGAVLALAAGLTPPPAEAGSARITAGGTYSVPVLSYKERFFATVVRQQYDYSCGSAAVATLLTHHYQRPTTEAEAFRAMFESGDQARIRQVGFSLLDIRNFLTGLGYQSDGFTLTLDALAELGVPAITLIETNGYRHFVVIKGVDAGSVLVGDPALGIRAYDRETFDAMRVNDIVFLIRSDADTAREHFNRVEEWRLRRAFAPLDTAVQIRSFDGLGALARIPAQMF